MRRAIKKIVTFLLALCTVLTVVPKMAEPVAAASQSEALSWVQGQVGKSIDVDGAYGAQCVDLIKAYYNYLVGYNVGGNGADYATNSLPSGWSRVYKGTPQAGDILVYSGNSSNPYGHVAIYESDRVHYHQNFAGNPYVQRITYMYNGLANEYWGYIRPNFSGGGSSVPALATGWSSACNYTDNNNAIIMGTISTDRSVQFTNAGAYVWDPNGNLIAQASEGTGVAGYYMDIKYNIVSEMGVSLNPGTTYTYQIWAKTEGNTYYSEKKTFATTGNTPISSISLSVTNKTINAGDQFTNSVTIAPSYANNKAVSWSSSNSSVARVSNGVITGVAEGTAVITASTVDGKKASCNVQVLWKSPFDDVANGSWYFDTIRYIYKNGLMTGLNSSSFGPAESLSRAQFAVILYRIAGEPGMGYWPAFPDIANNNWYTKAALWANSTGNITGYSNGKFGPADNITREQIAVILYRYAKNNGYDTSMRASYGKFSDSSKVSSFAKDAMSWAVGSNLIAGKDNGTRLDPQGNASRADCATIMMRFVEKHK